MVEETLMITQLSGTYSPSHIKGLKRWDEGRWTIGNKPQYSRAYIKGPLTYLPSSHLLSTLIITTLHIQIRRRQRSTVLGVLVTASVLVIVIAIVKVITVLTVES